MITSNYSTAMWLLYQTGRLILNNCKTKIADFTEFSAIYTVLFIDAILAEIDTAEQLPAEEVRAQEHEELRTELTPLQKTGMNKWQYLKRYITKAYAKEFWEMNWNSAGWQFYHSNMNAAKARNMFAMALQYIAANKVALLANNNMPATFEQDFTDAVDLFNAKYDAFLAAEVAAEEGTDLKIEANNKVYEKIIAVCEDGQTIYSEDSTKKGEFSFEKMSELIRPTGAATLVIEATNGETQMPQPGVEISIEGTDKHGVTNAEGRDEIGQLKAGATVIKLVADGFPEQTINTTLIAGSTKRIEVTMTPLFAGEMTVGSEGVTTPETVTA